MTFPTTGLPNSVMIARSMPNGTTDEDATTYRVVEVVADRPARYYRDAGRESMWVRQGVTVSGMVAFKAFRYDEVVDSDELWVYGGRHGPNGTRFDIVHATLQMMWSSRPSHWEIVLGASH